MKITFLGTGTSQGVPVIGCTCEVCRSVDFRDKRLRCSVHIETAGKSIVIDAGPDFRQQALREKISRLDAVLLTHEHKDHMGGLDDIRPFNFLQKKDMPIYGRKNVLEQLKREYAYAFADFKYPGIPKYDLIEIVNETFHIEDIEVRPIEVMHYKLPVFGFRIQDFTYITDANYISETETEKIKGSKIVVLNALQQADHISHYTLQQAVDFLKEIKPEQAYLVHMSHHMGLHKKVDEKLPDFIKLAYDGLKLEL